MSINIYFDKALEPGDEQVQSSLGSTWEFFDELRALTACCDQDWKHYGKKYGWKLKVHGDDKTLFELTVSQGWFLVAMAIRENERKQLKADLAAGTLADLDDAAAALSEGYVIRIEVRDRASCERARVLVSFIMARRSLV